MCIQFCAHIDVALVRSYRKTGMRKSLNLFDYAINNALRAVTNIVYADSCSHVDNLIAI